MNHPSTDRVNPRQQHLIAQYRYDLLKDFIFGKTNRRKKRANPDIDGALETARVNSVIEYNKGNR